MIIAGMPTAEEGTNIANLLFSLALVSAVFWHLLKACPDSEYS